WPRFQCRVFNRRGRIRLDELRFLRPLEQAAHSVQKVPRLEWRLAAPITSGRNRCRCYCRVGDLAGRLDYLAEDVFALAARCQTERCPCWRLTIARDQPSQAASSHALRSCGFAGKRGAVGSIEFRRSKFGVNTNARPVPNAEIPDRLSASGFLAL